MKACVSVLLLASIVVFTGCSNQIGTLTAVSTKNISAKDCDLTRLPQQKDVEGSDVRFLGMGSTIGGAVDQALKDGKGNLMIDAALYTYSAGIVSGYKVRGTVVQVPDQQAISSPRK